MILSFITFTRKCEDLGYLNTYCGHYGDEPPINKYFEKQRKKLIEDGWHAYVVSNYGTTGGNCWGGEADQSFCVPNDDSDCFLDNLFLDIYPEMSLLQYRRVLKNIPRYNFEISEQCYYGNSSILLGYYYNLLEVYEILVEEDIIQKPERYAILIGGLPCSGKTTLAKTKYKDYFLIDDPKDFGDIEKSFKKDKIVITDPYLSFMENRNEAIKKLGPHYFVDVVLLKVDKRTLRKRAKDLCHKDKLSFIENFKLET